MVSVQHSGYSFRLGQRGEVHLQTHQDCVSFGGETTDDVMVQVRLNPDSGGGVMQVPAKLLVKTDMLTQPKPLESFKHKSRKMKQHVLMRACMLDPTCFGKIESMSPQVSQPNEDHLSICYGNLSWAIEGKDPREENKIGFIPTQLSRTFLECSACEDKNAEQIMCIERSRHCAQRLLQIKDFACSQSMFIYDFDRKSKRQLFVLGLIRGGLCFLITSTCPFCSSCTVYQESK